MHAFLSLTLVLMFAGIEDGEGVSASQAEIAGRLHEINSKRLVALRDIEGLPNLVDPAADAVIAELEKFALGAEADKEFERHYAAVEKAISSVGIREHRTNREVYFAMLKAAVDETTLQAICKEFAEDVKAALKKEQERFTDVLERRYAEVAGAAYQRAQLQLRDKCDQVIAKYFEVWAEVTIPPRPLEQRPSIVAGPDDRLGRGLPGIAGILILIFRKTLKRVVNRILLRMGGKLFARLIPILGWLLLLLEVHDFATAKAKLEEQMRQTFMEEYKAEFTPAVVWKEAEGEMRKSIVEDLKNWSEKCKDQARQLLSAAEMLEAPGIKQWLEAKTKEGQKFNVVLKQMVGVSEVFGTLALEHEIDLLIGIIAFAPDRAELRELVQQLRERVVDEYKVVGLDFLNAAHHLGIPLFHEVLNDPKLTWKTAYDALRPLPRDSEKVEKLGVLNAVRAGIDPQLLNTDGRKEAGRIAPKVVENLAEACEDPDNLLRLLTDPKLRRTAEALLQEKPDLAAAWLTHRPHTEYHELEDDRYRKAVVDLYVYRREQRNSSAEKFVDSVTPWEVRTWQEVGRDGVEISDVYLVSGAGQHQEGQAQRAVNLYKHGVEKAALKRPELLGIANSFSFIPLVGTPVFNIIYPILPAAQWAAAIIALFLPLLTLGLCILLTWLLVRKFRMPRPPEFPQPAIPGGYPVRPTEPIQVKVTVTPEHAPAPTLPPREPVPLLGDGKDD